MMFTKHDQGMYELGYRYRLRPVSKAFEPLYCKSPGDAGPLLRFYPTEGFEVDRMAKVRRAITIEGRHILQGELVKVVAWDISSVSMPACITAYFPDGNEVNGVTPPHTLEF